MPPDGPTDWASREVQANIMASGSPLRQVPVLVVGGVPFAESLAIIEYINAVYPGPPLIPSNPIAVAQCRQFCCYVAAFIHSNQGNNDNMEVGMENLELLAASTAGRHIIGDVVTMAECFL
eukprot:CAMPEP_0197611520 /NCGR_PEP_ID=MMETSP1326-20131121/55531_1 /TAXON_ID=1155430 /ORGANISM="Genus nov. species nov., Strain RCC2288" /LENGTH=120 /DNA_ID=CAMNT_0043180179 /DNA_START=11 /DNA_END=370 /DNA_ORIENTATION=+